MMPGETHSKTAGIASEAAGSCQNCTSLQQSLNEYVAALITLKQKIIDSDHLLAEYQQKCDDLQYAERANETLRCQLEQILQKISPQEQNEAELKSLRAELEEKTSSLKIYQQTHMEYVRVKGECERSDMIKKKLEEKLKKMEETAAKRFTAFKRLQFEKKVTEKELKKIQKRLNGFKKARTKKVMKNVQTQVTDKEPAVMLDKQKIKFLLEELWGCIELSPEESSTTNLMFDKPLQTIGKVKGRKKTNKRKSQDHIHAAKSTLSSSHSIPEEISAEFEVFPECVPVQAVRDQTKCQREVDSEAVVLQCNGNSTICEDTTAKNQSNCNSENTDLEKEMEDIQKVMDWAKPLPRLLSPLELLLITTKQVFGEVTDSSDVDSCEGTHDTAANDKTVSTTLDKNLRCAQDETYTLSHMQTEDLVEQVNKQNNLLSKESDNIVLCTDDGACLSVPCSSKDVLHTSTKMETNCQDTEQSKLKVEVGDTLVSSTLSVLKQGIIEHTQMAYKDTSDHPTNNAEGSPELLLTQSEVSLERVVDLNESKLEKTNFSEGITTGKLNSNFCIASDAAKQLGDVVDQLETDQMKSSVDAHSSLTNFTVCNLSVNMINTDVPEDLAVDICHTQTSNVNAHVSSLSDNTRTGDLLINNNLSTDKNELVSMGSTVTDCDQKSSFITHASELSILPSTKQISTSDIGQSDFTISTSCTNKQPAHCLVRVHSEVSVPVDSSSMEDNLHQISSPPVDISKTQTVQSKQYITISENDNPLPILKPPVTVQESASSMLEASNIELHDGCKPIKEVSSALATHTFDVKAKPDVLDINILDKDNIMLSSPNKKDSTCSYPDEMESLRKEEDLDKDSSGCKKSIGDICSSTLALHETVNIDGQCEGALPEMVELPSSSLVDQKTAVTDMKLQPAESSDVDSVHSATCEFNNEQLYLSVQKSSPLELQQLNDECSTIIHTDAVDGSSYLKTPICHDISTSSMNDHIKLTLDPVTKDRDKYENKNMESQHMEVNGKLPSPVDVRDTLMKPLFESNKLCLDYDKTKSQDLTLQNFSSSSSTETVNRDYCEETIPKVLCSIASPEKDPVQYSLSNSNISHVKEQEFKATPEIPLKEHETCSPLDLSTGLERMITKTPVICHPSLDSSESEEEVIMRKVKCSHTFNKPIIAISSKTNSNEIKKGIEIVSLRLVEPNSKHNGDPCSQDQCTKQVSVQLSPQNECTEMENVESLKQEQSAKNGASTDVIAFQHLSDETDKISPAQLSDSIQSSIVDAGKNISTSVETESQKIRPGKNLIWNFNPDDLVEHRAEAITKRQKGKSETAFAVSNNCNGFDFQGVRKEIHPRRPSRGGTVLHNNTQVEQTVLANADTSTNTDHSPETINKVRSEMGPPLPPLLGPLLATPPRNLRLLSPIMSSSSRSSLPSPLEDFISPLPGTPFPPLMSPLYDVNKRKSPALTPSSPVEKANRRILSSPLQFCSATPKHALPVPGRLPLSATGTSTPNVQENSVKILDTMYPELSARARTLNILKGNVQLNRGLSGDCSTVPVSQITGFKPITSTSTAFIKTGSNSKTNGCKDKLSSCESQQPTSSCPSGNKRSVSSFPMPKSAKRLRLDNESPFTESITFTAPANMNIEAQNVHEQNISYCELLPDVVKDSNVDEEIMTNALKKIEDLCFDLLPVIRSHVHVGTIPKVPVMRNEEKEVIYEFSSSRKGMADHFLHVILRRLKSGNKSLDSACIQALCRVYVGLCRQLGDIERARILCYTILKEDFPEPDKLLLFIISSWSDLFSLHGVLSKAIQAILKSMTEDEVGQCLSAYLNWEKVPPVSASVILSSVLMAIQLYPDVNFCESQKYGEDLPDNIWEYVFAVDLLCNHCKWVWTHDNVISKELWPVLDKWVKRKKGNCTIPFVPDIVVATVLRILGHLCQMGLKEGFVSAVKNISSVIVAFIQHANEEGMPWGVQLASVYMLCDLAPSNPAAIHHSLQTWKEAAKNSVPPAVENYIQEVADMCIQGK